MKQLIILSGTLIMLSTGIFLYSFVMQSEKLRHVVVFKFRQDADEDKIRKVTAAFRNLKEQIPGITSFEHGLNNSPEGKNLGFTHVYLLTFENEAARDAYLPHPQHKLFGRMLGEQGILEDVFVVDYVPQP